MPARSRHAALVPGAERWSTALYRLRDRILDGLGPEADLLFDEAALALDVGADGELLEVSPLALEVMADSALYDVRRDGRNAIEHYRDLRRPSRQSKEGRLLAAMGDARCSVYRARTVESAVGLDLIDLLGGPARFVVDPEIAVVSEKGFAYVARLVDLGDVVISAGPMLPLGEIDEDLMRADFEDLLPGRDSARLVDLTPEETARLNARLWRVGLDVTTAALAEYLEAVAPEPPGEVPPRIWLPGEPYDLPDLGQARQWRSDAAHLRRLSAAPRPPEPLIVTPRPSLLSPPTLSIQRAKPPWEEHRPNLAKYLEVRQATADIQNRVLATLSKDEFNEAGARLGFLHDDVLVFESEHEMSVMADFAIYDLRPNGRSPVERYLEDRRSALADEERELLEAMVAHRYGILMVEGTEPGVGVAATDLLGGPPLFVYDVHLSQTAEIGLVLATRLIAPAGLTMTTGAALPLVQPGTGDLDGVVELFARSPFAEAGNLTPEERADLHESIVRFGLEQASGVTFDTRDAADPSGSLPPPGPFGGERALPRVRGKRRPTGPPPMPGRRPKRRR